MRAGRERAICDQAKSQLKGKPYVREVVRMHSLRGTRAYYGLNSLNKHTPFLVASPKHEKLKKVMSCHFQTDRRWLLTSILDTLCFVVLSMVFFDLVRILLGYSHAYGF